MLDTQQKECISELIQNIYSLELIFQDLKINEEIINWNDTKFIIPNHNKLEDCKNTLKSITNEKIYNRIVHMIKNESIKTLKHNINNIHKVINYSYKVIENIQ